MSKLYAENNPMIALEAGKKAVDLGLQKNFDVHFRDAVCKVVLEVNAIVSGHDDEDQLKYEDPLPESAEDRLSLMKEKVEECESTIPKTGDTVSSADLSPQTIILLFQIAKLAKSLWDEWRKPSSAPSPA